MRPACKKAMSAKPASAKNMRNVRFGQKLIGLPTHNAVKCQSIVRTTRALCSSSSHGPAVEYDSNPARFQPYKEILCVNCRIEEVLDDLQAYDDRETTMFRCYINHRLNPFRSSGAGGVDWKLPLRLQRTVPFTGAYYFSVFFCSISNSTKTRYDIKPSYQNTRTGFARRRRVSHDIVGVTQKEAHLPSAHRWPVSARCSNASVCKLAHAGPR